MGSRGAAEGSPESRPFARRKANQGLAKPRAHPLLRGRARPLAKLDAADEAGLVVGQRQRTTPVTAPRRGVRQIGSALRPACSVTAVWRPSATSDQLLTLDDFEEQPSK